jgi:hypothetical protein
MVACRQAKCKKHHREIARLLHRETQCTMKLKISGVGEHSIAMYCKCVYTSHHRNTLNKKKLNVAIRKETKVGFFKAD